MSAVTKEIKQNVKRSTSEIFIPADKQAQYSLLNQNRGYIRLPVSGCDGGGRYEDEFVDKGSLPSEYEDEAANDAAVHSSSNCREALLLSESNLLDRAIGVQIPLLEDIIVSGLIAERWSRANANMSTYFKCYHLYDPEEENGTYLAGIMGRPRSLPERYSKKYGIKKRSYQLAARSEIYAEVLTEDMLTLSKGESLLDAAADLFACLESFLDALVESVSWDSEDSFDLCAEIYAADEVGTDYAKAVQMLCSAGCARTQVDAVMSLIKKFKQMEACHDAL
jgi:hypothetical protein